LKYKAAEDLRGLKQGLLQTHLRKSDPFSSTCPWLTWFTQSGSSLTWITTCSG